MGDFRGKIFILTEGTKSVEGPQNHIRVDSSTSERLHVRIDCPNMDEETTAEEDCPDEPAIVIQANQEEWASGPVQIVFEEE